MSIILKSTWYWVVACDTVSPWFLTGAVWELVWVPAIPLAPRIAAHITVDTNVLLMASSCGREKFTATAANPSATAASAAVPLMQHKECLQGLLNLRVLAQVLDERLYALLLQTFTDLRSHLLERWELRVANVIETNDVPAELRLHRSVSDLAL